MDKNGWQYFALGSAFFAGLTAILAKAGVAQINSNLATLIRTEVIILAFLFLGEPLTWKVFLGGTRVVTGALTLAAA